jgi:hypothetical protein
MHNKRAHIARTIAAWSSAVILLALLPGCATVALTNLTPTDLPENPSEIYTFSLRVTPKTNAVAKGSVVPHIVVDGKNFTMKPSDLPDIYEFDYQVPPGRQEIDYYYLVDYTVQGNGGSQPGESYTGLQKASILRRYILSLEANRGPVGATVGIVGRGFTPQDVVTFNGTEARTVYSSPTSLSFYVPALPPGSYQVAVKNSDGVSNVGAFRIDPVHVSADPTSLALAAGQRESLTFTLSSPAPAGGLLLDLTTDVPESVIMPEVIVPAGQTSVSITVEGGRPGSGTLRLQGFDQGLDIPVTVH